MSTIPSLEDVSFSGGCHCSDFVLNDLDKEQYNAYCDYIECRDPAKKDKLLQALTEATDKLEIYKERNNLK